MIWYLNESVWMKMKNKRSKKKCIRSSDALFSTVERLKAGLLLLVLAVFFQFLARNVNGFAQWYATSIYKILVTIISRVCSVFPFSIVEILLRVYIVYCQHSYILIHQFNKKKNDITGIQVVPS